MRNTRDFAIKAILVLLLAVVAGCSGGNGNGNENGNGGGSPDSNLGSLQIAHTLEGMAPQDGDPSLYSFISGLEASGNVIYGPLKLPYAEEHTIADVPTAVVSVKIEYRLATGRLVAIAQMPVQVQGNQLTQVLAVAAGPPNNVIVELVNDTDSTNNDNDSDIFVLFDTPMGTGSVEGIELLKNSGTAGAHATAAALNTLWPAGAPDQPTLVSPYTGKTRPIYSFTVDDVDSGRLTFSYATATSIVNGTAPTATSNIRYDKLEISYASATKSGGGNLTAIDFFAIPLQVEILHWGDSTPDPLQTKSIYASTPTILNALRGLDTDSMGPVFRNTSGGEYQFPTAGPHELSLFARALSPNTIAAAAASGSSAPYPSFGGDKGYLETLVGKTYALNGAQYGGYNYKATFDHDGKGGYTVQCTGMTTGPLAASLPANAELTLHLPKDQLDFFIYATVANNLSYSVAGFPFVDDSTGTVKDKIKLANASPYGAMVGDIQAALNFGYLGGRFDSSIADKDKTQDIDAYYTSVLLPYAYPYGGARVSNDGFYNPYAGLFYYLSDAYGHPYSDRLAAASPLYSLRAGDTVRITILNDYRLDTPLVKVVDADTTTLKLTWPTVANATGYTLELSPKPKPSASLGPFSQQAGAIQSHTITGLTPGTSYLASVTATGSNSGQTIQSAVLPVQGVTHDDPTFDSGTGAADADSPSFKLNLGLTPNFSNMSYKVNSTNVAFAGDANIDAEIGVNTLQLSILDANQTVVYRGTYFVNLEAANEGFFDVAAPFELEYNLAPLTQAGPPTTPPYPLGPDLPLTVGTPFTPKPYYQFFDVMFP
jgi:Fibronectin type III domain